ELLRRYGAAVAMVDDEGRTPIQDVSADFVYARLRRSEEDEPAGYPRAALDRWVERARAWCEGGGRRSGFPAAPREEALSYSAAIDERPPSSPSIRLVLRSINCWPSALR